jgi:hypothetical protein
MFTLPTQTDSDSDSNENNTQTETETVFGGERVEEYEDYWQAISMVRLLKKSCQALGVAKVKDQGKSPWADHYGHFAAIAYGDDNTEGLKQACKALEGNLPAYKDEFEAPEGEFDIITAENADEFGLPEGSFGEDEDCIFVPVEYEAPETVWFDVTANEATVTEVLEGISGIGEARATEAYEALKATGLLKEDNK